jgi:hypothetical protein
MNKITNNDLHIAYLYALKKKIFFGSFAEYMKILRIRPSIPDGLPKDFESNFLKFKAYLDQKYAKKDI